MALQSHKKGGIFMTYAERIYYNRHKKQVESTEDYLNRVTKAYNEIDKLIGKLSTSKDYNKGVQ